MAEFDRFADQYRNIHSTSLTITGETPEYFARYKVLDYRNVLRLQGAPNDGTFLDFGCGVGASGKPFSELMPQAKLVCADVSSESLDRARVAHENAGKFEYLLLDGTRIDLPDRSIDGAFASCVFHHIPPAQHLSTLAELRRVLKPGAPLMIYEHNPLNPLTVRAVRNCPLDENAVLIGGPEMARLCSAAGFKPPSLQYRVFFPAALSFLRVFEDRMRWLPLGAQYLVCAENDG